MAVGAIQQLLTVPVGTFSLIALIAYVVVSGGLVYYLNTPYIRRVYDIDRIISRTVSYAVVTAILALVLVATILISQIVLASFYSGNSVAVAASTLVVAALFQPLRRRVQAVVDRRFNRSRYHAERTVTAFGARPRDEIDLAALDSEVRQVIAATVAPVTVGVWIRRPNARA